MCLSLIERLYPPLDCMRSEIICLIKFSIRMTMVYTFFLKKEHVYKKHETEVRQELRNIEEI